MSTVHHTKLQINGPSGHCSHLDFHPPPEVLQPSLFMIGIMRTEKLYGYILLE